VRRKKALSIHDIRFIANRFLSSTSHNDLLFTALLVICFHGLLRLGELMFPDNLAICDWQKVTRCNTLCIRNHEYQCLLPAHKEDNFFEGNQVLIRLFQSSYFDSVPSFLSYVTSCDTLFPSASLLWLTSMGDVPTCSFLCLTFMSFFQKLLVGCQWTPAVQPTLHNSELLLESYKPLDDGHLTPGKSTSRSTPCYSKLLLLGQLRTT